MPLISTANFTVCKEQKKIENSAINISTDLADRTNV